MIVLASQSPRRRELLAQLGVNFTTQVSDFDESALINEGPEELVKRLALMKAQTVFDRLIEKAEAKVIGSDTIVTINGRILGKPKDKNDAVSMLELLSSNTHQVYTAVALLSQSLQECVLVKNNVSFCDISLAEIEAYWQTGESIDKAGSYAIQGIAAQFISHLEGSYSAVMGLPLYETAQLLKKAGVKLLDNKGPENEC